MRRRSYLKKQPEILQTVEDVVTTLETNVLPFLDVLKLLACSKPPVINRGQTATGFLLRFEQLSPLVSAVKFTLWIHITTFATKSRQKSPV